MDIASTLAERFRVGQDEVPWPLDVLDALNNPAQWAMFGHVRGLLAATREDHDEAYTWFAQMQDSRLQFWLPTGLCVVCERPSKSVLIANNCSLEGR